MTNYFTSHTFLSTQLTGLASSNPHSLLYTMRHQNNLSDEQGGTWRAPRSGAPTALWWDSWNMQRAATPVTHLRISAPLRYPSPINPFPHPHPKNPSCTHTHIHLQATDTNEGMGWGARRRLRVLIFTSPSMTLCNWWHKWPPAARLSCFLLCRLPPFPRRLDLLLFPPCFTFLSSMLFLRYTHTQTHIL